MPSISSSVAANTALSILARNDEEQAKSIARISSGSRIVEAGDDAAGLAVATELLSDVAVFKQAGTNTQQSQAILSIAQGATSAVGGLLERQAVLAAQASSATVSDAERVVLNQEFQALSAEIDAVQGSTSFNGSNLVDGSFNQDVLVGTSASDIIALDLSAVDVSTANLGTAGLDLLNSANASAALNGVQNAIGSVASFNSQIGALQSRFEFRGETIETARVNTQAAASSILDVDIAAETSNLARLRALTESAIFGVSQANQLSQSLVNIIR